jgi:hypothetical protein
MNTPLVLIQRHFPQEVVNIIQSFMRNEIVYQAIYEYFNHLFYEKDLHDRFIYNTYIAPQCYCHRLRRNKDCQHCYEYEYTDIYKQDIYLICIEDNYQFHSIYGWTHRLNVLEKA